MKNLVRLFLLSAATLAAQSVTINTVPTREFGHPMLPPSTSSFTLPSSKENFVEGRELSSPLSIAFDTSVSPPIVYVADTFNNRVLAWRNTSNISKANFADKVIGQTTLQSTNQGGPGTVFSTGLSAPAAVAVDAKGNLYVADEGNNRILRYPAPFNQTSDLLPVDLVIGQRTINSGGIANEGSPVPSQKTLSLFSGGIFTLAMAIDAQGNLWVTDPGNNRVLRFPVGSLAAGTSEPPADLVLGQNDFGTSQLASGFGQKVKSSLYQPGGLAFDQSGRLYVSDSGSRVLQYIGPFVSGQSAARILGVPQVLQGQTVITYPTSYTLGSGGVFTGGGSPEGLFTIGNNLFVCDSPMGRIVRYDDPANWAIESTSTFSPPALTVIGQTSFTTGKQNQGLTQPNANTLAAPSAGAAFNNGAEIWIVDTGNHRVIALPQAGGQIFNGASRVLGQLDFIYGASNLVEGRELFLRSSVFSAGGVVIDKSSNPPHLYVADTFNNRVLGFTDARVVGTDARTLLTQKANLVIGQPDLMTTAVNYPSTDPTQLNDSGLNAPIGLALDAAGNLFVADYGNSRILRFPSPFSQSAGALQHAKLVLGQPSFTGLKITDPSSGTMSGPWGLALFDDGSLAASDVTHNRVLVFNKPAHSDFSSGQAAGIVLGQSNFTSTASGAGPGSFNSPRHIATDTFNRLYVADAGNNRLLVFTRGAATGTPSSYQLPNLSAPQGVIVSSLTGEIWVANTGSNQIFRFPEFQTLQNNGPTSTATLTALGPLSIALDASDNLVALEATNRMTFYFASLAYRHVASYNQVPLAPGMLAAFFLGPLDNSPGSAFTGAADASAQAYPWPTTLSDLQLQVNGVLAPIFKVVSGIMYVQIPSSTPDSGTADFVVSKPSTNQIVASGTFYMAKSSPGFFTANAQGFGQVAALNADDNSVNSPTNGVVRGHYITLYLTGLGAAPGSPSDGSPRTQATPGAVLPVVIINGTRVDPGDIEYSGLADFAGGWQINVKVPANVPPQAKIPVVVLENDVQSNVGPNGQQTVANGLIQTITAK